MTCSTSLLDDRDFLFISINHVNIWNFQPAVSTAVQFASNASFYTSLASDRFTCCILYRKTRLLKLDKNSAHVINKGGGISDIEFDESVWDILLTCSRLNVAFDYTNTRI